jgi:site-specific DNA-methyltransferase (adenine-specific)
VDASEGAAETGEGEEAEESEASPEGEEDMSAKRIKRATKKPKPVVERGPATMYCGDMRDVVPHLGQFTACVTDPPYELGFMGKSWDKSGIAFAPSTWKLVLDAVKPGGMLLAFGGSRTFHRIAVAIEDAGWEIRDCMMWLYGSGFPKSYDISKGIDKKLGAKRKVIGQRSRPGRGKRSKCQKHGLTNDSGDLTIPATDEAREWQGYGTALKPAFEPIIVAMKPLTGSFAEGALERGVAGINVDAGRIGGPLPITRVPAGKPGGRSLAGSVDGSLRKSFTTGGKGRWPSNVVLDDDAAAQLDVQTDERRSRFFYTAKVSRAERQAGLEKLEKNMHPTVKPLDLMRYLLKLVTMPKGTRILDPFAGSGPTLIAAKQLGIEAVGVTLDAEDCRIADGRLSHRGAIKRRKQKTLKRRKGK